MATQYDPTTFGYQNFYSGVLQSDITSANLTLTLDTVPSPTSGILVIEPDSATNREVIFYTSKGPSTITCPSDGRGWAATTATSHLTGSTIIMADVKSYFEGLSDGTLSTDPARLTLLSNFVVSGGVVAQSAGLIGTFSDIVFYLAGRRYSGTSIPNKTYTASKDTYVDITGNSTGAVSVTYTEVSNNATAPALTTNYLRIAKVVSGASAITSVSQTSNSDGIGNLIRNSGSISSTNLSYPCNFSVYRNASWSTPANNFGKVQFDSKEWDSGNNFDNVTNFRFVAPYNGFYEFMARVGNTSSTTVRLVPYLYKNSNQSAPNGEIADGTDTQGLAGMVKKTLQLAINDFIEVWLFTGSSQTGATGTVGTYFQGIFKAPS